MQIKIETNLRDRPLWLEGTVQLTSRGASYSDDSGDFGPELFDAEVTEALVFTVTGDEIFDSMESQDQVWVINQLESEALK